MAFVIVVALVLAAQLYTFRGCQQQLAETLPSVSDLSGVFTKNITEEFISTAPTLSSDSRLLVASLTLTEVMSREHRDIRPLWFDQTQYATLNVRVAYHFAVPFDRDRWDLIISHHPTGPDSLSGGILLCNVIAPPLEPILPPAPDTSEMTIRKYNVGWGEFDQGMVDELIADMTPTFVIRAQGYVGDVREIGRRQIERFVQTWISVTERGRNADELIVRVTYRDELVPISLKHTELDSIVTIEP